MDAASHGLIPTEQDAPALLPEQAFLRGQVVTAGGAVMPVPGHLALWALAGRMDAK